MKIKASLTSSILALLLLTSCDTPKVAYLEDAPYGVAQNVTTVLDIRIRPTDKITILVNSKEPLLTDLLNLPIISRQIGTTNTNIQQNGISTYTVDPDGFIDFPVLGAVKVDGLTRTEVAALIKGELIGRNIVNDPVVTVEFANLTISVLGEVNSPGRFSIDKDRISLLDALSMAGDLTIYGLRDNIRVQREKPDGSKVVYTVNINSAADLYDSPVYYLQQNDIVYVEPNTVKARQSTVNGNNIRSASLWISVASLIAAIVAIAVN